MLLTLLIFCFIELSSCTDVVINRLHKKIFDNYNPDARPIINPSAAVDVAVGFHIESIRKLESSSETLVASIWVGLTWKDEFLVWNATDYDDIRRIVIPAKRVWIPDLYFSNSVSIQSAIVTPGDYNKLSLYSNGTIVWYFGRTTETRCRMNLGKFPFDTQICSISLAHWTSTVSEVKLSKKEMPSLMEESGTWNLAHLLTKEEFIDFERQQQLILQISLSRYPLYYVLTTILPICLLAVLNPVVFLVPAESGEKISLSVSILLAYSVILSALSELLPEVSDNISILGVYVCTMLCLKVVSVVASVGAVSLYHRSGSVPEGVYHWLGKNGRWGIKDTKNHLVDGNTDKEVIRWQDVSRAFDRIMFYIMSAGALLISIVCAAFIFQ